ncbi:hypothetical protein VP01_32g6 [Puccinia sorghi]|uniref:Uncharacterized protein n=1 Tax=Puccinia sorghi TaxID=27349 RepID=A0A0L6UZA9_9BASI|nr:hypothetical protein VP01_32g6 [Puccinia sorghi]
MIILEYSNPKNLIKSNKSSRINPITLKSLLLSPAGLRGLQVPPMSASEASLKIYHPLVSSRSAPQSTSHQENFSPIISSALYGVIVPGNTLQSPFKLCLVILAQLLQAAEILVGLCRAHKTQLLVLDFPSFNLVEKRFLRLKYCIYLPSCYLWSNSLTASFPKQFTYTHRTPHFSYQTSLVACVKCGSDLNHTRFIKRMQNLTKNLNFDSQNVTFESSASATTFQDLTIKISWKYIDSHIYTIHTLNLFIRMFENIFFESLSAHFFCHNMGYHIYQTHNEKPVNYLKIKNFIKWILNGDGGRTKIFKNCGFLKTCKLHRMAISIFNVLYFMSLVVECRVKENVKQGIEWLQICRERHWILLRWTRLEEPHRVLVLSMMMEPTRTKCTSSFCRSIPHYKPISPDQMCPSINTILSATGGAQLILGTGRRNGKKASCHCFQKEISENLAAPIVSHKNEMTYLMNIDMRLRNECLIINFDKVLGPFRHSLKVHVCHRTCQSRNLAKNTYTTSMIKFVDFLRTQKHFTA